MILVNTYKQTIDQTLNNAWTKDAYISLTTCNDTEGQIKDKSKIKASGQDKILTTLLLIKN